jgi:ubiquitin C-terminal hydrolase
MSRKHRKKQQQLQQQHKGQNHSRNAFTSPPLAKRQSAYGSLQLIRIVKAKTPQSAPPKLATNATTPITAKASPVKQHANTVTTTTTPPTAKEKHTNDEDGELFSRKRTIAKVSFVYPQENGKLVDYYFGKAPEQSPADKDTDVQPSTPSNNQVSKESLDDILYKSKKRTRSDSMDQSLHDYTDDHDDSAGDKDRTSSAKSQESRKSQKLEYSVVEAVKDKFGCRPRANSTDNELQLPRRGLCDEGRVLEAYQWKADLVSKSLPKGFSNLGNTCFLNSTLQCLSFLPPFTQSVMSMPAGNQMKNGFKAHAGKRITLMLRDFFYHVHSRDTGNTLAPRQIVQALPSLGSSGNRKGYKFRPGRQEDAHEFLVHLLDAMQEGELQQAGINPRQSGWRDKLPVSRLDETTFVHRVFGGYFRSQVQCTSCGHRSNTYDPFLDLSLEVSHKSCQSILDSLKEFTRKETLDSANRWKCSGCKKRVCATKQLTVFRPPLALCIQLKRFAYSGGFSFGGFLGGRGGKKISKPIAFPSELKLPLSDSRSCEYILSGLVIHVGGSANSGHYTSYIKRPSKAEQPNQWFHMDDSFVQPVSEKSVLQQRDAYILFYTRKEVKVEFPTPPLRNSMSAEEAEEFGKVRARARADSLSEQQNVMPALSATEDRGKLDIPDSSKDASTENEEPSNKSPLKLTLTAIQQDAKSTPSSSKTKSKADNVAKSAEGKSNIAKGRNEKQSNERSTSSSQDSKTQSRIEKTDSIKDGTISSLGSKFEEVKSKATSSSTQGLPTNKSDDSRAVVQPAQSPTLKSSKNSPSTVANTEEKKKAVSNKTTGIEVDSAKAPATHGTTKQVPDHIKNAAHDDGDQNNNNNNDDDDDDSNDDQSTSSSSSESDDSNSDNGSSSSSAPHVNQDSPRQTVKLAIDVSKGKSIQSAHDSASSSSSSSSSDSSSESITDPESDEVPVDTEKTILPSSASPPAQQSNKATAEKNKQTAESGNVNQQKKSNKRVSVFHDRGPGREKVEVMMRTGSKQSVPWQPKSQVGAQGESFELLGNIQVSKWDEADDMIDDEATKTGDRSELLQKMKKDETKRQRNMYLDRWDAMLDQGKTKKVKQKSSEDRYTPASPANNSFQRIQASVQSLNRGKAKGLHRVISSVKRPNKRQHKKR